MSVKQCRAVAAIADLGSFAAAAERLNLTQSAISMQVTSLEERLGVVLFDRSHRPPRLTDAGRIALAHARTIVAEYDSMIEALSGGQTFGATLRVGVVPTVLSNMLPAALMVLRRRGQAAPALTVTSALSGDLAAAVERGEIDAALMHQPPEIRPGFVWREIKKQQIVVIAPRGTQETDLATLFATQPYIRFNRAAWVAPLIERRLKEMALEPNATAELQSIDAIRLLVSLGFGVSIVPAVADGDEDPAVRSIAFGDPPLFRTIGFVMRASLADRPAARIVGDAFEKAAAAGQTG